MQFFALFSPFKVIKIKNIYTTIPVQSSLCLCGIKISNRPSKVCLVSVSMKLHTTSILHCCILISTWIQIKMFLLYTMLFIHKQIYNLANAKSLFALKK